MRMPLIEELQKIYCTLQDNTSRDIYAHRLLYVLLGRKEAMAKIIYDYNPDVVPWKSEKVCFYGAGKGANWSVCANSNVRFVIDKYKTGVIEGIPIISLDTFLQMPDCREYLLILTQGNDLLPAIEVELDLGKRDEYFVDVGAFDGATTKNFFLHCEQGHSYIFEPNPEQFDVVKDELRAYGDRVELFPYGAYNENTVLRFDMVEEDETSGKISENGSIAIEVRKLDDLLGDRKVTFIKMDVEASELAALRGVERIIREQRPKLAICIYHKPEDMWEIPSLILQYDPSYKFYVRHYSITHTETVLYAV